MSDSEYNSKRPKRERNLVRSKRNDLLNQIKNAKNSGTVFKQQYEVQNVFDYVDDDEYNKRKNERLKDNFIDGDSDGYYDDGDEIFYQDDEFAKAKGKCKPSKRKAKDINSNIKRKVSKLDNYVVKTNTKNKNMEINKKELDLSIDDYLKVIENQGPLLKKTAAKPLVKNNVFQKSLDKPKFSIDSPKLPEPSKIKVEKFENSLKSQKIKKLVPELKATKLENEIEPIQCEKKLTDKPKLVSKVSSTSNDDGFSQFDDIDFDEPMDISTPEVNINHNKGFTLVESIKQPIEDLWTESDDVIEDVSFEDSDFSQFNESKAEIDGKIDEDRKDCKQIYWLDAYNDLKEPGVIFLFGKTMDLSTKKFVNCCVNVNEVERKIYFLLKGDYSEKVYNEISGLMKKSKIDKFRCQCVSKKYAFQNLEVPDEGDYLLVQYDSQYPQLSADLKSGQTFSHVFGVNTNYLETFILDLKLKGPCWLDIYNITEGKKLSTCKLNYSIKGIKHIAKNESNLPQPPLSIISLNIKTCHNDKTNNNEIVSIGCLIHREVAFNHPPPKIVYQEHFTIVTNPKDAVMPYDFATKLKSGILGQSYQSTVSIENCERSLLNSFLAKMQLIDPDLFIGHSLLTHQIDLILRRCIALNISFWHRLGRLKPKLTLPRLTQRNSSWIIRMATAGRLLCDVEICARELIKCRNYDLMELAKEILTTDQCNKFLPKSRQELVTKDVLSLFNNTDSVKLLIDATMGEAFASLYMMHSLQIIPLAFQITSICGNLLARTLTGGKSERVEYLLLHAFTEKGYICPDKYSNNKKNQNDADIMDDVNVENGQSRRGKPTFLGGLVLEPKRGLYNNFILLMDFNSLYPSIIQEHNICFTTIDRRNYLLDDKKGAAATSSREPAADINEEESAVSLISNDLARLANLSNEALSKPEGILPRQIKNLVDARRVVKGQLKSDKITEIQRQQLNIKQQALKITANSMYGCLGFGSSRFQAKSLAALVTCFGRNTLLSTKQLVESGTIQLPKSGDNKVYLDIVYGDTDSVMVNTGLSKPTDFPLVMELGQRIKREVNKKHQKIELDIDGVFKKLLLLKKKKYAALCVVNGNVDKTKQELKGLDIVRRDWCKLSVDVGHQVVSIVLESGLEEDGLVLAITVLLKDVADRVRSGKISPDQFVITKALTRDPELYGSGGCHQPHVQVALRLNKTAGNNNKRLRAKDCIEYVICKDGTDKTAAQRAYSIRELLDNSQTNIVLDIDYYLAHQLHPVISRLLDVIEGLNPGVIAECLGLDPRGFNSLKSLTLDNEEKPETPVADIVDHRYVDCKPLSIPCRHCKTMTSLSHQLTSSSDSGTGFWTCTNCQNEMIRAKEDVFWIQNQITLIVRQLFDLFYKSPSYCEACHFSCIDTYTQCFGLISLTATSKLQPLCPCCKKSPMTLLFGFKQLFYQLEYYKFLFSNRNLSKIYKEKVEDLKQFCTTYLARVPGGEIEMKAMPFRHINPNTIS